MQILFIHGRAQEHFSEEELLTKWISELRNSFMAADILYPEELKVTLPCYGPKLIEQRNIYLQDIKDGKYQLRSTEELDEFKLFKAELIESLKQNTDITEKQVAEIEQEMQQERGWKNWPTTIAIAKLIDKYDESYTNKNILRETDDVVTYLVVPSAKNIINSYFLDALTLEPTIIVAHSLGTVIAYNLLHSLIPGRYDIRGLITLGSPLGVHAIIRQLHPAPTYPPVLKGAWVNIYDKRDIVSLRPLEAGHFRVNPNISNCSVENSTDNRHGIEGYLSNELVARTINEIMYISQ